MKPIKKTQAPSNLLFFDTETKAQRKEKENDAEFHYLWFGFAEYLRYENGAKSRHNIERFSTVEGFWNIVCRRLDKSRPLYVFAHNVCFDLTIVDFWRLSETRKFDIDFFVIDDPPTMFGVTINGCKAYFIDTLNFWRTSLAKIGESLGYPKLEFPGYDESKEVWDKYCSNDVSILTEAVCNLIDFIIDNNLGKFSMTAASLSLSAYKHRFMQREIFIHDRLHVCELEREAYYGGLVECFYLGSIKGKKVFNVDINSLYPYVMLNEFPTKLKGDMRNQRTNIIRTLRDNYALVAMVDMDTNSGVYPKRVNKRFCMVQGNFTTCLCGPELLRAYDNNEITNIHRIAWYEKGRIFDDYVSFFWEKRKEYKRKGNVVYEQFCKLLMNSLYGKFAQRGYRWVDFNEGNLQALYAFYSMEVPKAYQGKDIAPRIKWGKDDVQLLGLEHPVSFRRFRNKIQIHFPLLEHHESFPLISAYVTAYGREYLRSLIDVAGRSNVYYCDTDSLFVNIDGFNRLSSKGFVDPSSLGKLKLEGISTDVTFYCPKDYIFGDKAKTKGVRKNAEKLSEGVYRQLRFEGIRSVLGREPEPYIKIDKVTKRFVRRYEKGIVLKNGWTAPFTLQDNEVLTLF